MERSTGLVAIPGAPTGASMAGSALLSEIRDLTLTSARGDCPSLISGLFVDKNVALGENLRFRQGCL